MRATPSIDMPSTPAPGLAPAKSAMVTGPERCRQIVRHYEAQGIDQLIFLVQAGGTRHEDIVRSLRLFGEKVIPRLS